MFKDCKIIFINEEGIEDRDVCRDLNNRTIEIFKEIESSLVYRGIRSNQYKSFFSKDLFIVGEKAWIFDNSPKVEKMILTGRYEKNMEGMIKKTKETLIEALKNREFCLNCGDIGEAIQSHIESKSISEERIYLLMKAIIHKIQDKDYHSKSPFLSTSSSIAIAKEYAGLVSEKDKVVNDVESSDNKENISINLREEKGSVVLIICPGSIYSCYIDMSEVVEFAKLIGIKGFRDRDNEKLFVRGVLPHNILGYYCDEKEIVINPGFKKLLDIYPGKRQVVEILKSAGLPINQEHFGDGLRRLDYKNYYIDYGNGAIEIKY